MARSDWTREELILAFNLYCKLTFTRINANNKSVKELADIIGRSNNAVAIKLANFARLDPALHARNVKGMSHGGHGEELIWNEFNSDWDNLAYESELILSKYTGLNIEQLTNIETNDLPEEGKEREALVRIRVNQSFFRRAVLVSYKGKCCITGISNPELLIASHIKPWSVDTANRVNPSNGLCLNALHDRAFEQGLLTITPDYKIILSKALLAECRSNDTFFRPYINKSITLPSRFLPDKDFLQFHYENYFIR